MCSENKNDHKETEIKVITGDGKDLNISPVYEHIKHDNISSNNDKKKNIVIPKGSSDSNK